MTDRAEFSFQRAGFSKIMLALACIYLHPGVATACPAGTVFSAKSDGTNGICAVIGEGATPYVQCYVTHTKCPAGTSREHSSNDPSRDYCCPLKRPTSLPSCNDQCASLLTSVQPRTKANRVHQNCMSLCIGNPNGRIICPDLTIVRLHEKCP